jgi:uncharacterized membrane protein
LLAGVADGAAILPVAEIEDASAPAFAWPAQVFQEGRLRVFLYSHSGARPISVPCLIRMQVKECQKMSNLVVLGFDGIHTADEVLNKLRSLQKEYLIDLEDACMVERDPNGKVHIKQAVNLTAMGAAAGGSGGAFWGTLVGLLFLNPLAGFAIGGLTGAGFGVLSGMLADYGISDDFIKKLGATIPEGSSALFVLFRSVNEDKVLPEIEPHKPRVLKTSLSNEAEQKLKQELSKAA